jgi:DNA-directed RNA polymerase subunit RPC12/RpoP
MYKEKIFPYREPLFCSFCSFKLLAKKKHPVFDGMLNKVGKIRRRAYTTSEDFSRA